MACKIRIILRFGGPEQLAIFFWWWPYV